MAIGRISGPLLKANLVRNGIDLAFETDLLYFDVNNARVGVNTAIPATDFDVNGTLRSTTMIVDNQLDVGNLHLTGNTITSDNSTISFRAAADEATVYHSKLHIDDFEIAGNSISTRISNSNIELRPNGAGTVDFYANTNIDGDLYVSGNISADGNITIGGNIVIGDSTADDLLINASIKSDLIPDSDDVYSLGSPSYKWLNVYVNNFFTDVFNTPSIDIGNLMFRDNEITTTTGQDIYIDGNGSGGVQLGNFKIVDNTIMNVSANAISIIEQTGTGYFKIDTTNGFVPPVGNNAQRPSGYEVIGMTRYNTESKALEIWDGVTWASPAGSAGAVSVAQAEDIAAEWALILG